MILKIFVNITTFHFIEKIFVNIVN